MGERFVLFAKEAARTENQLLRKTYVGMNVCQTHVSGKTSISMEEVCKAAEGQRMQPGLPSTPALQEHSHRGSSASQMAVSLKHTHIIFLQNTQS